MPNEPIKLPSNGIIEPMQSTVMIDTTVDAMGNEIVSSAPLNPGEAVVASTHQPTTVVQVPLPVRQARHVLSRPPAPDTIPTQPRVAESPVVDTLRNDLEVPVGYYPITLSSCGKLGMPTRLHVRDYTGADALKMASTNHSNRLSVLLSVLQGMIWEKIDVMMLTPQDVKEILINIHFICWGGVIEDYFYPFIDEEFMALPEDRRIRLAEGKEFLTTSIDLSRLNFVPIQEHVKEPFTITDKNGVEVKFRIERISDEIVAERYVSEKFRTQEEKYARLSLQIEQMNREKLVMGATDIKIDPLKLAEFNAYFEEREALKAAVNQALLIHAYNGKFLDTLEEKLDAYKELSSRFWTKYQEFVDKEFKFGVDEDNVVMESPLTEEEVTRKVTFRPMDFVPSSHSTGTDEFTVQFS